MEIFNGVRFATAERLKMPVMEPDVTSVHDLVCREIICPQTPSRLEYITGPMLSDQEQGEDCLRLGIFTPSLQGNRPVVVFIHGGAFVSGSGLLPIYHAAELAEEIDAVVVTVSYRLGAFGFLCLPDQGVLNLGVEDQMCALRWIRRNIAKFGGNPEDITVAGQSGGAYCIAQIIATCHEPLFQKANLMSAPLDNSMSEAKGAKMAQKFLSLVGADFIAAPVSQVLRAQVEMMGVTAPRLPFNVVGDSVIDFKSVMPGLRKVFITCAKDDAMPFSPHGTSPITPLMTWMLFLHPMKRYATRLSKAGIETRTEIFSWRHKEGPFGTTHCIELPLLFGSWQKCQDVPMLAGVTEAEFNYHSHNARRILSEFVHS